VEVEELEVGKVILVEVWVVWSVSELEPERLAMSLGKPVPLELQKLDEAEWKVVVSGPNG